MKEGEPIFGHIRVATNRIGLAAQGEEEASLKDFGLGTFAEREGCGNLMDAAAYYADILKNAPVGDSDTVSQFLSAKLPDFWCSEYQKLTFTDDYPYSPDELDIVSITLDRLTYLYGMGDAYGEGNPDDPRVESRVVAVYGHSQPPRSKRDTSRMRGWLGPTNQFRDGKYDKGHFIAHMSGGGLDINLFYQRRDINRGWSKRGKVYRQMERYCAENLGTFCFSRPLYNDRTWHPCAIEYGILLPNNELWVEWFNNQPPSDATEESMAEKSS